MERTKSVAVFCETGIPGSPRAFADGPKRDLRFYARRVAVSGSVIGLHLVFLLLVLYAGWKPQGPAPASRLTAIDISAPREPSRPARPAKSKQVHRVQGAALLPSAVILPLQSAASGSGDGTGCATAALVAQAISESPAAMAALAALPASLRTEADAVMLWNGSWQHESFSDLPLGAIRQTVIAALTAAPPECLAVDVTGPQIIPVQEPDRTTMLVVGSGVWRWSSIVDPPAPETAILQTAALLMQEPAPTGN